MKPYKLLLASVFALILFALFGMTALGAVARGDADANGKLEASDARLALRAAVGLEVYPEGSTPFVACDVQTDGLITAADARMILRAAVGLELLSFNNNFYMPLTIAETDDFSVTLVAYFNDGLIHGFDFDITNKHPSHTLEIDVSYPAVNSYMPDGSMIAVTVDPGETATASMIFDRDILDKHAFLSGGVHDLQLSVQAYDLSAGNQNYHPTLFDKICRVYPNKAHTAADAVYQYPYENNDVFLNDGRFTVAYLGNSVQTLGGAGEEANLVRGISLRFAIKNTFHHAIYCSFENLSVGGDYLSDHGGKYLYPGANGMTVLYFDPTELHIYLGDLDTLGFTLRVWDSDTQTQLYCSEYSVDVGKG